MSRVQSDLRLRAPGDVMTLDRLGSLHQNRLSFMRILTRRMASEAWCFERTCFEIDLAGVGHAVYTAKGPERSYALIAFAHDLPDDQRSDRVIAEAWDATFALFDGVPEPADIARLAQNVPLQEAGRLSEKELCLSRANRSVRLWAHVVDALAQGRQPDPQQLEAVGYLMRTTAVYGSGKFGAADRAKIADRPELAAPFQAEMLSVYLIRAFIRDLVEHAARARGGAAAVRLDPDLARRLGIGNSTGLGMAPFLINHPVLFNNWIQARETAVARVRALPSASSDEIAVFLDRFRRAAHTVDGWRSQHPAQIRRLAALRADIALVRDALTPSLLAQPTPWDRLMGWAEDCLSLEGQEWLAALILEPYPDLVDDLAGQMSDRSPALTPIDGAMPVLQLRDLLRAQFGWALDLGWDHPDTCARAWYVSEEKLEPRLGERFKEPITAYEQPLAPARDAAHAMQDLTPFTAEQTVADFLLSHPEHRHTVRRAQIGAAAPYSEIRSNTIAADMMPIDMLRAKLSFFGATRFDPRSDRWVRITMFAGAPYPEDLTEKTAEDWVFPEPTS